MKKEKSEWHKRYAVLRENLKKPKNYIPPRELYNLDETCLGDWEWPSFASDPLRYSIQTRSVCEALHYHAKKCQLPE